MDLPKTFVNRTIQYPGYEFFERDTSEYKTFESEQLKLVVGYSSSGPIGEPVRIDSLSQFEFYFGTPRNEAESYFYHTVKNILDSRSKALVIRMPYGNKSLDKTRVIKYSFQQSTIGRDYKSCFDGPVVFKSLKSTVTYVDDSYLTKAEESGPTDCDFIIANRFNSCVSNEGTEILVTVLGQGNALVKQGLVRSEQTFQPYSDKAFISDHSVDLLTKSFSAWDQDNLNSLNDRLINQVPQIKTRLVKNQSGFYDKVVDLKDSNQSAIVIVSIVKKSTSNGKFTIYPVEVFCGDLNKNSIDRLTKESSYLGDIIEEGSTFIRFIGKEKYAGFDHESTVLFPVDQSPLRLSLSEKEYVEPVIIAAGDTEANSITRLEAYLKKVNDPIEYQVSDVFDAGLSSILTYAQEVDDTKNKYYVPELTSVDFSKDYLKIDVWLSVARVFSRYCKYVNHFSISWLDGPYRLFLNGPLSRDLELGVDLNAAISDEILQSVSIASYSESTTNVMWIKMADEILKKQHFFPPSSFLAYNVGFIDVNAEPWVVPAGQKYGIAKDAISVAACPEPEFLGKLYSNRLNYANVSGNIVFQGNKTNWQQDLQLNRINNRRLVNYLKRHVLGIGMQFIGEPNTVATRLAFKETLSEEFERVKNLGGLDSYSIDVGSDINSELTIQAGELRVKIIVKPVNCVEFILGNFVLTRTGIKLDELGVAF